MLQGFEGSAAVQLTRVQRSDHQRPITLHIVPAVPPAKLTDNISSATCTPGAGRSRVASNYLKHLSQSQQFGRAPGREGSMPRLSRCDRANLVATLTDAIDAIHGAHGERHARALAWVLTSAPAVSASAHAEGLFLAAMTASSLRGLSVCRDRARTPVAAQVAGGTATRQGAGSG
jgi:hypothetical protein